MKFDIIGKRYFWFALSLLIMVPGLLSIAVQGFNLGIDFTGGTLLDLKFARIHQKQLDTFSVGHCFPLYKHLLQQTFFPLFGLFNLLFNYFNFLVNR